DAGVAALGFPLGPAHHLDAVIAGLGGKGEHFIEREVRQDRAYETKLHFRIIARRVLLSSEAMPILILGAKGTLGGQLRRLWPQGRAWDREEVDVTDFDALSRIRALDPLPAAIVNCVAFNDVDGAESNPGAAHALNTEFPGRFAALAASLEIPLVHYSTN